jgi:hypothetical protein
VDQASWRSGVDGLFFRISRDGVGGIGGVDGDDDQDEENDLEKQGATPRDKTNARNCVSSPSHLPLPRILRDTRTRMKF